MSDLYIIIFSARQQSAVNINCLFSLFLAVLQLCTDAAYSAEAGLQLHASRAAWHASSCEGLKSPERKSLVTFLPSYRQQGSLCCNEHHIVLPIQCTMIPT